LADPAQDARARDASFPRARSPAQLEQQDAAAEPCRRDGGRSAAQSCAAQAVAAVRQQLEEQPGVAQSASVVLTKL